MVTAFLWGVFHVKVPPHFICLRTSPVVTSKMCFICHSSTRLSSTNGRTSSKRHPSLADVVRTKYDPSHPFLYVRQTAGAGFPLFFFLLSKSVGLSFLEKHGAD